LIPVSDKDLKKRDRAPAGGDADQVMQIEDDAVDLNIAPKGDDEKDIHQSSLMKSLRRQIEFYLSTSNLVRDKFLREILKQNTSLKPQNCIKITTFLKFNRIKAILEGK